MFGLSLYTEERDLDRMFSKYGPIEKIQIVYDVQTGRSRGFGFVYFKNVGDAEQVYQSLNHSINQSILRHSIYQNLSRVS